VVDPVAFPLLPEGPRMNALASEATFVAVWAAAMVWPAID